ncbi:MULTISPECIES: thioesterase family protein [unclassified Clostridium]|uniref:thioesterase family protein n=1 Tax=Clostridium TaxID=1485 RepID=UPI0018AAEBD7|nr:MULTISPECIES: thioesterase family protein [unclassified Clostridium]MBX9136761.1 thioesterase family protein [Clostridium sp. K12(2020)]MBX9145186.1 thioesterase family protein [Clostridium sp. K13]MDU2290546.1 thioesterase family protein [Clostridium celatum]MDU4325041.1 thioesterase family protein [Clostridium celatum]
MIKIGIIGEVKDIVNENNIAKTLRSGELRVYATPAMVALMEEAAYKSIQSELEDGKGTVGTVMNIKHIDSTPIGMEVTAKSELIEVDRRRLVFKVEAFDERGKIGEGIHERFIIDNEKFQIKTDNK